MGPEAGKGRSKSGNLYNKSQNDKHIRRQGNTYKLNVYETEEQLNKLNSSEKDKIILTVRGDVQQKEEGKYEAYASGQTPVEINGILLYKSTVPITITESVCHEFQG